MTLYYADYAWLGGDQVTPQVVLEVDGGTIGAVRHDQPCPAGAVRLAGLTLPAFADAHSHAFHRALRGRTHRGAGTFWTWREDMYAVAAGLTPDTYFELARATYAEMALAGIASVGEFHYLHHDVGGHPYADPNAMGHALISAAAEAGERITLLDTCYLAGGPRTPLAGPQVRFGDGDADRWAARVDDLRSATADAPHAVVGGAIHSVRAVPPEQAAVVAGWAAERGVPVHAHLSEQRAENEACRAAYGRSPTEVLSEAGVLTPRTTVVHATHLSPGDITLLGSSSVHVCLTPTTERDLADGLGPAGELARAGASLVLGSDSNAVIDPLEETRALELHERLRTERRGHFSAAQLLSAAGAQGHASLGWAGGQLRAGAPADFTTIALDAVRLAGWAEPTLLESVIFAATSADVTDLVVGGRRVVADRQHTGVPDVPGALHRAVRAVLPT